MKVEPKLVDKHDAGCVLQNSAFESRIEQRHPPREVPRRVEGTPFCPSLRRSTGRMRPPSNSTTTASALNEVADVPRAFDQTRECLSHGRVLGKFVAALLRRDERLSPHPVGEQTRVDPGVESVSVAQCSLQRGLPSRHAALLLARLDTPAAERCRSTPTTGRTVVPAPFAASFIMPRAQISRLRVSRVRSRALACGISRNVGTRYSEPSRPKSAQTSTGTDGPARRRVPPCSRGFGCPLSSILLARSPVAPLIQGSSATVSASSVAVFSRRIVANKEVKARVERELPPQQSRESF